MKPGPVPLLQRVQDLEKLYAGLAERVEKAETRLQYPAPPTQTYQPVFQRWGPNSPNESA